MHVLNQLEFSGAEILLAVAADLWQEHGVQAQIVAKSATLGAYASELRRRGYSVTRLDPTPSATLPYRFADLVRRRDIDVVHLHTEHANFWLAVAARLGGARVVRTVHAQFDFYGGLRSERTIQRYLLRRMGAVTIAVSQSVASNELARFNNPARVIPNWIDSRSFRPVSREARFAARRSLSLPSNALVLLSVGNCDPVKRHDIVLELTRRRTDSFYLHVGAEDAARTDRRLSEGLGVASRTRFCGSTTNVVEYLQAADVFVMASDREGSPLSAIEALASGVPCLLRDIPSLREAAAGSAARLFGDLEQAAAILTDLDDTQLNEWRSESEHAASEVRWHRNADRGAADYARAYRGDR